MKNCSRHRIIVPLRIVTGSAKQIIGPYARVEKHYYLALGFNLPDPLSPRWELHILADPGEALEADEGLASILGFKALVKYECLRDLLGREASPKLRVYFPPWGIPLILVEEVEEVPQPVIDTMIMYGLSEAEKLLRQARERVEVEEV